MLRELLELADLLGCPYLYSTYVLRHLRSLPPLEPSPPPHLSCLTPNTPQDPRPVMAMLWELLELADLLGCPRLHLCVDHRQHPTQSLLTPGLAAYQVRGGKGRLQNGRYRLSYKMKKLVCFQLSLSWLFITASRLPVAAIWVDVCI